MIRYTTDPQHSGRRLVVTSDRAGMSFTSISLLLVSTIKGMRESAKCMIWRDDESRTEYACHT